MKLLFILMSFLLAPACFSQTWEWAKRVNGLANDYVSDVHIDSDRNVYITGRSKGAVTFEDLLNPISPVYYGHTDAFIAKYDKDGNLIWANQGGSNGPDWGWGVVADDNGNTYYTGEFSGTSVFGNDTVISNGSRDVFISKLDPNGNFLWTISFGGSNSDKGKDIEMDAAGNIYCTGFVATEVTIDNQTIGTNSVSNAFILKLDSNGNYIHIESIEPKFSAGYHLKSDDNGHIYLTGELLYDSYIAGTLVQGPANLTWRDGFLAKMDTAFQVEWIRTVASSFHNIGESIAISDDYVYMTGCYTGVCDFSGISLTYNGTGNSSSTYNASRDIFVSKYDFNGNIQWAKGLGGLGYDYGFGIDVTHDNVIYVAGTFQDTVLFDLTQVVSSGNYDMFICRLDENGNVDWVKKQGNWDSESAYCLGIDEFENIYCGGAYRGGGQNFDSMFLPTTEYTGVIGKITQHPFQEITYSNSSFCLGDTFQLSLDGITSPLSYEFLLPSTNSWVDSNTYYIIPSATTNLIGEVIISNNIYSDTIPINHLVEVFTDHSFDLGNDTIVCSTSTLNLTGPIGQFDYNWSNGDSLYISSINQTGQYSLELIDTNGCITYDTILVTQVTPPVIYLGADSTICDNDSLELSVQTGQYLYSWSSNDNTNSIVVTYSDTFWVEVTDTNNCSAIDSIIITEFTSPVFNLGNDTITCDYNSIQLNGPTGNYDYTWSNNDNTSSITVNQSDEYWLEIIDSNNCFSTDTIIVDFVDCTDIEQYDNEISIQQSNDYIKITTSDQYFDLLIVNVGGQVIQRFSNQQVIPIDYLPKGVYFAYYKGTAQDKTLKFIKF